MVSGFGSHPQLVAWKHVVVTGHRGGATLFFPTLVTLFEVREETLMLLRNPSWTALLLSATTRRIFNHRFSTPSFMASQALDCNLLVLCGKSLAENETAKAIKTNNTLKLPGNGVYSLILHAELDKAVMQGSFQIHSFMDSLSTNQFGRLLIWSPQLPSTHDIVSQNFCELPIGSVCVADVQTKGRGRSKNVWESPLGCLMFSFTLQMEDGRVVPLVQYVVSLAITEAVKDICYKNGLPSIDVKIKWPNDLYLNGSKVGGILCTSSYKSKKFNVSAGIGLNVNNEKPTTSLNTVLNELSTGAYQFQREDILAAFFKKFEELYGLFVNQGFQTLEELYIKTWLHRGQSESPTFCHNADYEAEILFLLETLDAFTGSAIPQHLHDMGWLLENEDSNRVKDYVFTVNLGYVDKRKSIREYGVVLSSARGVPRVRDDECSAAYGLTGPLVNVLQREKEMSLILCAWTSLRPKRKQPLDTFLHPPYHKNISQMNLARCHNYTVSLTIFMRCGGVETQHLISYCHLISPEKYLLSFITDPLLNFPIE
ncbi:unnamed protein product [Sphenostylis stenocarpa]|uniref:BPL/LPL catalytic domain-containing protein n=1 Tax=Sphenostylis stenocarpa TaxID=92480 RepID=A0AA86T8Z1_9FABA|nr:unnamed protein product [Sphenostylis stenocarpa]